MKNNHIVIMAGGIGSRFWPMSTPEYPKQFIDVLGMGRSLIQMTVDRFSSVCPLTNFWVVTSEKYIDIVKAQLPEIPQDHILAEPEARNTAPCIAYACWKIKQHHEDANIVVTPSDALVVNTTEFARVIGKALSFTEHSDAIVTIGIKPSRPETGYGYIATSDVMASDEKAVVGNLFPTCEKISIDYAVMEKAKEIYVLPAEFGWSDLGSWGSLRTLLPQDERNNACVGNDVKFYNSRACVVHVPELKKVVIEGLNEYIVAEKNGQLLICSLANEQMIKEFAK